MGCWVVGPVGALLYGDRIHFFGAIGVLCSSSCMYVRERALGVLSGLASVMLCTITTVSQGASRAKPPLDVALLPVLHTDVERLVGGLENRSGRARPVGVCTASRYYRDFITQ